MNETEGILDRLRFWENIKVYKDVTSGDLLKLLDAAKTKDPAVIRPVVVSLVAKVGYAMDAKEVDEIVTGILAKDPAEILYETGDYAMKFSVQHLGYVPEKPQDIREPLIRMMATNYDVSAIDEERLAQIIKVIKFAIPILTVVGKESGDVSLSEVSKRTENFTNAEAKAWLAENRSDVRKGGERYAVRAALRNAPEVLSALTGKPVSQDDIPAVEGFIPAMIPVVIVLKMIVARYDSNHPTGSAKAVGEPADKGLSLGDL